LANAREFVRSNISMNERIDGSMNRSRLNWAKAVTGDGRINDVERVRVGPTLVNFIRPDDACFRTFRFDLDAETLARQFKAMGIGLASRASRIGRVSVWASHHAKGAVRRAGVSGIHD
jgi:hypothetical protein